MGSVKSFFLRNLFPSYVEMVVLDVLYHLIIYLWTKRYKCCIKSANYVKLAYLPLLCLSLAWNRKAFKTDFFFREHLNAFCLVLYLFNKVFN